MKKNFLLHFVKTQFLLFALFLLPICMSGQNANGNHVNWNKIANYDEDKVHEYVLPDLMTCNDGSKVTTKEQWEQKRRQEVLETLISYEYGRTPYDKIKVSCKTLRKTKNALDGKAICKQVRMRFSNGRKHVDAYLMMYIPISKNRKDGGKCPVFVSYNFKGNHSTIADEYVLYSPSTEFMKLDSTRGNQSSRWCFEKIIDRGYAVATMCYDDIFPDYPGYRINGADEEIAEWNRTDRERSIISLFPGYDPDAKAADSWMAISAWAWGSSRIADYLLKQNWVDKDKLIVMGHSRQGKAALWAGALDERFKVVISNESGCGGAAIFRRKYGETAGAIMRIQPQWFCPAFWQFDGKEENMPFDQHWLMSLIAPRHAYVASAEEDRWSDPKGEYLGLYNANPVYELYGMKGIPSPDMPPLMHPVHTDVGYHIREGKHDVTDYDWECYMDFCDKVFGIK
jgi:hypothetical protein